MSGLIELGAGTAAKTRVLLDALTARDRPLRFHLLDINHEVLLESVPARRTQYPHLCVEPKIADFHDDLVPLAGQPGRRLLLFLGGTIGNFDEEERAHFLDRIRCALSPGDHFLLGADLVKDPTHLIAAYDDPAGVTAAFNRNALKVIATTLDTRGLDPNDFAHETRWDPNRSRIEMHLRATRDVTVHFPSLNRTWRRTTGTRACAPKSPANSIPPGSPARWTGTASPPSPRRPTRPATTASPSTAPTPTRSRRRA